MILIAVNTGSDELQRNVNRIIDAELTAMLQSLDPDTRQRSDATIQISEKIGTRNSGPPWGTAVDGVCVRLTKAMAHSERSDRPLPGLRLFYDVKNEGSHKLQLLDNGRRHQVEVDGQWYEWIDPRLMGRDRDGPIDTSATILLDFEPGSSHEDKRVDVVGGWLAIPKEMDIVKAIQARQAVGFGSADFKDHGRELVLNPGKHQVRVAVICLSGRGTVRAVSEAVDVEIVELAERRPDVSAADAPPTTDELLDQHSLDLQYAMAAAKVARAEYAQAIDANKKVPGTVSQTELKRLETTQRLAKLEVERVELSGSDDKEVRKQLDLRRAISVWQEDRQSTRVRRWLRT